ncbi:MAG: universal stress protein [Myxococcales bacterium]|nr:MAG: universal stress protein [Myxococcales bacterium]
MDAPTNTTRVVIAALDGSPEADHVLARACELTRLYGAQLHIAHVTDTIPVAAVTVGGSPFETPNATALLSAGQSYLERMIDLARQHGVAVESHQPLGNPTGSVVDLAREKGADLLVVGTHDPGGLERLLLGSVSETLVREAPCSVLVVRPMR